MYGLTLNCSTNCIEVFLPLEIFIVKETLKICSEGSNSLCQCILEIDVNIVALSNLKRFTGSEHFDLTLLLQEY